MYSRRADNLSEETIKFLDDNDIKTVVDSIVSVVSGTFSEVEENYGASLYFDGQTFQHSVDCECMCCLLCGESSLAVDVRRRLFHEEQQEEEQQQEIDQQAIDIPEDRTCNTCGMYESYSIHSMGYGVLFQTEDYPSRHLCLPCYELEKGNLCQQCGEPLSSVRPCCGCEDPQYIIDREGDVTYLDEYENEDLPENNTEKVKQVKESVKEMGSLVFDLQDKLTEGEYLLLMDHLQKITNTVNSL